MEKVKIFLASSGELDEERKEIALFLYRETKSLIDKDIFLDLVVWENLLHSFRGERIQNYFNDEMLKCDIVIALFYKKVGQFTYEEFELAYKNLCEGKKPYYLFVFFKDIHIDKINEEDNEDIEKINQLKRTIEKYGQIYISFNSIEQLNLKLKNQFNKVFPNLKNSNVLQNILKTKYSIIYSDLSPDTTYEQDQKLYEQLERDALSGQLEAIEKFIYFVKNKYLHSMAYYSRINKDINYLTYWNKVFGKDGSISKIGANAKTKSSLRALQDFRHEMEFSNLVPAQSIERFNKVYNELEKAALKGNKEDIEKFISFLKDQYFPFLSAYMGNNNSQYIYLWEKVFGENGVLIQIEANYKKQ